WSARRTSSSLTNSTAGLLPLVDAGGFGLLTGSFTGAGVGAGAVYMLPASASSISGFGSGADAAGASTRLPARKRSTIAAISWRSILPPAIAGSLAGVGVLTAG